MSTATTTTPEISGLPMLVPQIADNQLVDLSRFAPEQRRMADEVAASVDLDDSNTVLTFGSAPQKKLSEVLDSLLQGITADQVGLAGDLTIELAEGIKRLNLQKMKLEANGDSWLASTLGGLPLIGRYFSALRHFYLVRQEVLSFLDRIVRDAEVQKHKILENNGKMDQLIDVTEANVRSLEVYIAAGELALLRSREEFDRRRAVLAEVAAERRDALAQTRLRDFAEQIAAFETRLLRMKVAFADGILQIPQVRLTQQAGRIEVGNIMDTLLFDIPRLKAAMLRIASLNDIRKANAANAKRREITREIGQLGAEALSDAYLAAKATQGQGQDDVAALTSVADRLLQTIEAGSRLDQENKAKRIAAGQQIADLKTRLVKALEAADQAV
jgi:uncharacterized protein YaaN involved in tellurite resistance